MKIAYFGYDFFAPCLDQLLVDGHTLVSLFVPEVDNVYDYDRRVLDVAQSLSVPIVREAPTEAHIKGLDAVGCELMVVAAYPHRVPVEVTDIKGVNVHPSLLPDGRGRWPLPWVVLKGLHESGVTVHKLSPRWDAGDILAQGRFPVAADENLESLSMKCRLVAKVVLRNVLNDFDRHWNVAKSQGKGETWPMPQVADRTLDWTLPVAVIDRRVRAFGNFDSCAIFDEKEWVVQDAICWQERHAHEPGTVVVRSGREVLIAASDGYVCIRSFRLDPDFAKESAHE